MAFCEKCGGQIAENMKFCEKCGASVSQQPNPTQTQEQVTYSQNPAPQQAPGSYVPPVSNPTGSYTPPYAPGYSKGPGFLATLAKPGSNLMFFIGIASMATLALTYIICMFIFMADLAFPIGTGCDVLGNTTDGASGLWMVFYFLFNLFPIILTGYAFFKPEFRKIALLGAMFSVLLTLFSLIVWGVCEPDNYSMAVAMYTKSSMFGGAFAPKFGTLAWFAFNDCLSEAWYLKLPLALGAVFGLGLDFIANGLKRK